MCQIFECYYLNTASTRPCALYSHILIYLLFSTDIDHYMLPPQICHNKDQKGIIHAVPLNYSDEDILSILENQNVTKVLDFSKVITLMSEHPRLCYSYLQWSHSH